jgi:TolB-like protein
MKLTLPVLVFAVASAFAAPRQDLDQLADRMVRALPDGRPAVAVLPLEGKQGVAISEYLVASLQASGRATVVERAQFQKVMGEQALALSGATTDSAAAQAGKLLSARYLVVGSVGNLMGSHRINLRLLDVESGKVLEAGSVTAQASEYEGLDKTLLGEQGQTSAAVFRSAVMPGWGQFYTNHPVRGSVALVSFLGSTAFMGWSFVQASGHDDDLVAFRNKSLSVAGKAELQAQYTAEHGVFDQAGYNTWVEAQAAGFKSDRDDAIRNGQIGIGLMAGVYALNLVDAWWCGAKQKRAFDLYFSGNPTDGSVRAALAW